MFRLIEQFIAVLLATTLLLGSSSQLLAQTLPDTRSPLIELEAIAEAAPSTSQVFTAEVLDDRGLKDVLLYHRRAGQQAFSRIDMLPRGDGIYFSVTLETDPTDLRAIEYYVQARDDAGNRTVEGFAFDPYTLTLIEGGALTGVDPAPISPVETIETVEIATPTPITPSTTTVPAETASGGGIPLWQIVTGVVLAGVVVGVLASSSGGDSGSAEEDDGTVPLTINLSNP